MREIVVILGINAAGKSTIVKEFADQDYTRINRDELGGSLDGVAQKAEHLLKLQSHSVVLDNTYATVKSRQSILEVGKRLCVPVRCVWVTTSLEDAQVNACMRMMEKYGKILDPAEFKTTKDPNAFPPAALYHYRKEFQEPTAKEGFVEVEERPFVRVWAKKFKNKAIIFDYDDTLRHSTGAKQWPTSVSEVELLPDRKEKLQQLKKQGWLLLGASNQSAIAKGLSLQVAVQCFEQTNKLLGVDIEYFFCPHKIPPVTCYCRKPAPGMIIHHVWTHKLLPSECTFVGDSTSDKTCATRAGMKYMHPQQFFGQ